MKKIIGLLLTLIAVINCPISAEKITFDDLYSFPQVNRPQFSPDGKKIVFETDVYDSATDKSSTEIWTINLDGTGLRQLADSTGDEWNPQWSPDGKFLAYESDTDSTDQIWLLSLNDRSTRQLTKLAGEAWDLVWSHDSKRLLFVSDNYPGCKTDSCNRAIVKQEENNPIEARLYDHLLFRHYKYWDDGWVNQLFAYDLNGESVHQLTSEIHDVPTSTLGGHLDYAFSDDSREICFVMNIDSIPTLSTNNDLFTIESPGDKPKRITENMGQDNTPRYSPDGKYISYLSQARAGYESDQCDLVLYDRKSGERTNLTTDYDRSIGYYQWSPDSKFIYFQAIDHGFAYILRIEVKTTKVEALLTDAVYGDFDLSPDSKTLVVIRSLSNQPDELYLYDVNSKNLKRLTYLTEELTKRVEMHQSEEFWFDGFNGDSIHGFLTLPPDFDSTSIYPLILLIHGGPQWCWLGDFNYYGWNTQLTAAQGYVVAQIDPHGSVGYGLKFKEYVSGNWGKGDFDDLMIGLDYLIAKYPFIDTTRMAALGRSYGGFMINWINGHTDRFKCMISIDGTFDQISEYGATDELWFPEWEAKGTPWTNYEEYYRSSPSTYAANFKTPTMFIHGQKDYRVDVSEGLQAFTTLQRLGIPSQLLYYPDEGHSIIKVRNARYAYEKQFEWLARWLK